MENESDLKFALAILKILRQNAVISECTVMQASELFMKGRRCGITSKVGYIPHVIVADVCRKG